MSKKQIATEIQNKQLQHQVKVTRIWLGVTAVLLVISLI